MTGRQDEGRIRLMMVKKRGFHLVNALAIDSNKDDHRKIEVTVVTIDNLYFSD